jgi:hypothetical protein
MCTKISVPFFWEIRYVFGAASHVCMYVCMYVCDWGCFTHVLTIYHLSVPNHLLPLTITSAYYLPFIVSTQSVTAAYYYCCLLFTIYCQRRISYCCLLFTILQCVVGYFTPQEDEQLKACDSGIVYIAVNGGIQVMPSKRGPGTLCIDCNECQAQKCAKQALECLQISNTLDGCNVNTTLPDGLSAVRLWRPPPELVIPMPLDVNSSKGTGSKGTDSSTPVIITTTPPPESESESVYFGVLVKSVPCEQHSTCWNSVGSYQCICDAGYERFVNNVTLISDCRGEFKSLGVSCIHTYMHTYIALTFIAVCRQCHTH